MKNPVIDISFLFERAKSKETDSIAEMWGKIGMISMVDISTFCYLSEGCTRI